MAMILDKKTIKKLGSELNHSGASKPSNYALKLMEKMGWKEGQGLGKNADGMSSHVVVHKREDGLGLGLGKESKDSQNGQTLSDHWWHSDFSCRLQAFSSAIVGDKKDKKKKDKKDKKRKREEESEEDETKKNKKEKKSKMDTKEEESDEDKEKKKSRKQKKEKKEQSKDILGGVQMFQESEELVIDYQELFQATGGKRLGMRARREQRGKILRTEGKEALVTNI
jgi:Pin2-interacting protein X1